MISNLIRSCVLLQIFLTVPAPALNITNHFGPGDDHKAPYVAWYSNVSYDHGIFLASQSDPNLGVALHWTIDEPYIHLAVAAKATGWVGFGLAEAGAMRGADIITFSADSGELIDTYVMDQIVAPIRDDCQSWVLNNYVVDAGFLIFEATRELDTGDTQDRPIINDASLMVPPTRVIAAWGDSSTPSYHALQNRARSALRFYGLVSGQEASFFREAMDTEAEDSFFMGAANFTVPQRETHYQTFCFSKDDLIAMGVPMDQALHTIGIEPIVDPRTAKYVHHFTITGSGGPWNSALDCEEFPGMEMVYVWAPGDEALVMPANVGGPLGLGGFNSFMIEVHYNNPWNDEGNVDSSGVRFHYTSNRREIDMGVFQTGDPGVALYGESVAVGNGLFSQHAFECSGGCSEDALIQPVTVFREHLHMHQSGSSMSNIQIRNGDVIRVGESQYWDFDQQGNMAVPQQPFTIEPGDSFKTICNYRPQNGEVFGLSSQQEMCIAFLFYYPRQTVSSIWGELPFMCAIEFQDFKPECGTTHTGAAISVVTDTGRKFGISPSSCPALPTAEPTGTPTAAPTVGPTRAPIAPSSSSDNTSGVLSSFGCVAASVIMMMMSLLLH